MFTAISKNLEASAPYAIRHALAAEGARARRYHETQLQTKDQVLRRRCKQRFDGSLRRATELALALVDMGEDLPVTGACTDFDDRLLDAMDAIVRRGAATLPAPHRAAGRSGRLKPPRKRRTA